MEFIGCGIIEVTSSVVTQQCRTGVYKMQPQTSNNKPVFKHETKEEFLYHMNQGKGFWMVIEFHLIMTFYEELEISIGKNFDI